MKRKLTNVERKIVEKQMKMIREEIDHMKWLKEYNGLMLSKGCYMNYLEKLRQAKKIDHDLRESIVIEDKKWEILNDQMRLGVEVKEKEKGLEKEKEEVIGVG